MVPPVQASALRATWQSHLLYNLIVSWNPATQHGECSTSIPHLQIWNWRVSTVSPDWARKRTSAIGRPVAEWKIHPNSSSPPLTLNQKRCRDTKGPETRLFHRRHCGHGFSTAASNGAKLKKIEEFVSPQMFCSDFIPGHIWVVRLHPMVWNTLNHCNLDALRNRLSTLALSKRSDSCWAISWVAVAAVHGKVDQDESSQELLLKGTNVRHGESQEDIKESYQEQTLCMLRHFRAEFICWGADNNARNLAEQRYDTAKRTIYIERSWLCP